MSKELTEKEKERRKKLAAGAAVVITAIGANAAVGDTPTFDQYSSPAAVVQTVDMDAPMDVTMPDDDEDQATSKKRGIIARVVGVPVYACGIGLIKLIEVLLGGVLSPFLTAIIRIVVLIGVVLGVTALCLKIAFPDVPLSKMLTKRRVISIAAMTGILGAFCEVVPLFWAKGAQIAAWIRAIGGLAITGGMGFAIAKLVRKAKAKLKIVVPTEA